MATTTRCWKPYAANWRPGPWLLGEHFTAADVLWGMALTWTTRFGVVPDLPDIRAYIDRFAARPALARVTARDAEWAAAHEAAAKAA